MPKSWSLRKKQRKKQNLADHTPHTFYTVIKRGLDCSVSSAPSQTTKKGVFLPWSYQVTSSIKISFEIVVSRILDKSQNFV